MDDSPPITAYIALGANLGRREENLRAAIARLEKASGVTVQRVSGFCQTAAVGGPADSPPYLNAAAALETTLTPPALLALLLDIERDLGRVRHERWEPRLIDLDLLLYGDRIIDEPQLIIPHPRMHQRRFVLAPLAEIAPDIIHPRLGKTIAHLLRELPPD